MPELSEIDTLTKLAAVKANDLVAVTDTSVTGSYGEKVKALPAALVAQGFTHAFVLNHDHPSLVATTTDNLDVVVTLMAIPANSVVDKARIIVTEAFVGLTACNLFAGRTGDPDGYIISVSALAKTVTQSTGAEIDTVNEVDVVTASDQNLVITVDPGANTQATADLTAGQAVLLVSLTTIDDYANLVPA